MRIGQGTRVLVTGAANGIGRLLAEACAARGAHVLVADLDGAAAEAAAAALRAQGGRAWAQRVDVADSESVAALREFAQREFGAVELLINNAGIVHGGPFEQVPLAQHLQTYRVNVEGLVAVTHAFFDDLLRAPTSHIVNIASASAFIGLPFAASYASSKWAVIGFSESLRLELAQRNAARVKLTVVCPSYIDTGMFSGVKVPRFMPFLRPAKIVAKIVQGIERDALYVKEPFGVRSLEAMRVLMPRAMFDRSIQRMGVYDGMAHWTGHAPR